MSRAEEFEVGRFHRVCKGIWMLVGQVPIHWSAAGEVGVEIEHVVIS